MIAVVAVCFCDGALAVAAGQPRHAPALVQGPAISARSMDTLAAARRASGLKQHAERTRKADRDSYIDPAAPYKANRLSSPRASEPIPNIPGQTTVLTREVLDDMKATSLKDALRSTAGVTIGR
ncbi:Plug domain-containing protein [Bradyrhizobium sp. AZCC 1693]|uniref:Plug domain-containing protein n=1 Tax=Bradyrhizobium sp. AZCC 1693 TaxID=3117029 RepID=UPI002FF0DF9D